MRATDRNHTKRSPDFPVAQNAIHPNRRCARGQTTLLHGPRGSHGLETTPNTPPASRWFKTRPTPTGVVCAAGRLCCMARVRANDSKPHQTLSRLPGGSKCDPPQPALCAWPDDFVAWPAWEPLTRNHTKRSPDFPVAVTLTKIPQTPFNSRRALTSTSQTTMNAPFSTLWDLINIHQHSSGCASPWCRGSIPPKLPPIETSKYNILSKCRPRSTTF